MMRETKNVMREKCSASDEITLHASRITATDKSLLSPRLEFVFSMRRL
jgi:hypothetical protein